VRRSQYSQNDEEAVLLDLLGPSKGRLLDVGAYTGADLSNSLRLIEMGWEAVLVEPAPRAFAALLDLHRDRPRVQMVNAALAPKTDWAAFHVPTRLARGNRGHHRGDERGDATATLSAEHRALWAPAVGQWDEMWLRTIAVDEFFAWAGHDFAFVSIDVEGTNFDLFCAMPWLHLSLCGLRAVCVEHEGRHAAMAEVLAPVGFAQVHLNAENLIMART